MHRTAPRGWAVLLIAIVVAALASCGEHTAVVPSVVPTPTPIGNLGDTTPEGLIEDMAKNILEDVVKQQVEGLLFPSSTIDYQALMDAFLAATQQLLDQQTITEQEGYVNGELMNLNEDNIRFLATDPSDINGINDIYNKVLDEEAPVNETLGVLEQYPQQSLAGWMSGAQVKLSFLGLEIQLDAIRDPANRAVQSDLANTLSAFIAYAVSTRAQVLYKNIVTAVNKVSDCEKVNPCEGEDNCSAQYTDCAGHTHLYNYNSYSNPKAVCDAARITTIQSCADNAYNSAAGSLAWMDDVLDSWRQSLSGLASSIAAADQPCAICQDALDTLTIDQMTYAAASTGVASSVARVGTSWMAAACNGSSTCDFKLATADFDLTQFGQIEVLYRCGSDPTERRLYLAGAGDPRLNDGAYVHLDCAPGITNAQAAFRGQAVQLSNTSGTETDLSTHSNRGPHIPKLNDDVFAPEGTAYNDANWSVVLPQDETVSALFIDLGGLVTLCGGQDCTPGPRIQASSPDVFALDTSTDGVYWTTWTLFPVGSGSGLRTRSALTESRINARYVRVWPRPGDGHYGISELQFFYIAGNGAVFNISGNKPSYGPEPLITNGQFAPEGTSWNNSTYASVLSGVGSTHAQTIDFGEVRTGIEHIKVQADGNDVYQVDASTDGVSWVPFYRAPVVNSGGLTTRDSGPLPPAAARYMRVYATDGDGSYSVAETQVLSDRSLQQRVCNGQRACYFSADELLRAQLSGAAPTAQDLQDFVVSWACADDPTPRANHAVLWNADPVVEVRCPASPVTCNANHPTTCSPFVADRADAVVYENAATLPYQICVSTQYPQCVPVIAGKTNYYKTNASTKNDPACTNVQRAIHDAIAEGSCPAGVGADASSSQNVWPYNTAIGTPPSSTCLPDPVSQPALLPDAGCGPLVN